LLQLHASVLAFHPEHPEDFTSDAPLQCVVCNSSYYCKNGERYACPGNSTAIQYADILQECICNPGYLAKQIPDQLTYDFYSPLYPACRHCPNDANFPFPQYAFDMTNRIKLWLDYAASIGATTNINTIGSRSGNPDNFGFTGVYANNVATPPNDLFFRLKLSSEYKTVTVIYRSFNEWIHLYINNVLQQSCGIAQTPWVDTKQECSYTTTYLPGSILEFKGTYYTFIGENLKFVFSNVAVTPYSCNLGLSPDWYLYGQRNSCPATKVVATHGSSSAEDCICPPGWYSQANRSSPCLPCPPGTFADKHNMSQCTACPANSSHDKTNQTNISACLCYAGWAGVAANGCVECAEGSFSPVNGSAVCQVCRNNSHTYDYPRTECKCHIGFSNVVTLNQLSSNIQSLRDQPYHLSVASPAALGGTTAGSQPTYFAQGGFFGKPFLRFSKTAATSGHNYIGPSGGSVSFSNGLTIVFVLRLQSGLTNSGGSDASFISFQRDDEHLALSVNVRIISGILHMCLTTYSGETCARADAPLDTWMQFTYTYNPSASPRGNVQVKYKSVSGAEIVWTATNNKIENNFGTRKIAFGTSVSNNCAAYFSFIQLYNSAACDRPIFDTAGFYFIPAFASSSDIAAIYSAIAAGIHLKNLPSQEKCEQCPVNSYKDYIGNLRATDLSCPACDPNAKSPVQSVSILACLCQGGFFDNGNHTCQACLRNQYKETASNHSLDLELCNTCPDFTISKESSPSILDCLCIPGYTGPNAGPCVQCPLGKYKGTNGSSPCIDCPLHTWADKTNMTACLSCQEFLKSPGGETDSTAQNTSDSCFCRPGYISNGTNGTRSCAPCVPGKYSLDKNLAECTACPQHTYTAPALFPWDLTSDCLVCKLCNTSTNAAFTDHYDAARGGLGCGEASVEVCTACPSFSSLFLPTNANQRNFGVLSCVCDENFYGLIGTVCTACPVGQNRTGLIYENTTLSSCNCIPGYEPDPAAKDLCRKCPIGTYKPNVGDHNCTVCPDTFTTEFTGNANFASCVCRPGYALSTEHTCIICPENTYKVGFNMNTTCPLCPSNSLVAAGAVSHLNCTCVPTFEPYNNVCNLCPTGKYGNTSINIGNAMTAINIASRQINLARACSAGNCPVTSSHTLHGWSPQIVVDGNLNDYWMSAQAHNVWLLIDMQETVNVETVRIYNRNDCFMCDARLNNFEIRVGNFPTFSNNPSCGVHASFKEFKDFSCVKSGRYFSLQNGIYEYLNVREIQIYGTKAVSLEYTCLACPLNTFTNNTGVPACEACAAGKTTDGRTGQVECVCDIGTVANIDGTCETCPASSFKATSTDKYANRNCTICGSCAANQQVNTECNSTHDVTCRACQANSWSSAGRKLLDPCFCNAGYELQGQLCVACPVGKARQANNNNSIMCEMCNSTTFTSVTTTASCGACSPVCTKKTCRELVLDCKAYGNCNTLEGRAWCLTNYKTCLANFGGSTDATIINFGGLYNDASSAIVQIPLPAGYDYVTVIYSNSFTNDVNLLINGVTVSTASTYTTKTYSQAITTPATVTLYENIGFIGTQWSITLSRNCDFYVQQECNASRDVICQECQTCKAGFFANNTCGENYGNDRLDTQCVPCPENAFCPGTPTLQQPQLCSEQRCVANQQVATLCNATHNVTCKACQPNSWSYAGRTVLDPCFCNAGYELQGQLCVACPVGKARQANANNSIMCETCGEGTFTLNTTTVTCQACSPVCPDVSIIFPEINFARACSAGACPATSSSVFNNIYSASRIVDGISAATGDAALNGLVVTNFDTNPWVMIDLEQTRSIKRVRVYNSRYCCQHRLQNFEIRIGDSSIFANNALCGSRNPNFYDFQDFTCAFQGRYVSLQAFVTEHLNLQEIEVYGYASISATAGTVTKIQYVKQECNASRDVICQECQTCTPGFYANNTCGTNYSNDRLDTQCVPCPAGYYCPTGLEAPILCPDNGRSPPGSDDLKDCDCDPGYFRDVDGCSLCHFDFYCPGKQIQYAIACPLYSRTASRGSTSRLDCHCHTGFFRDPPESLSSFNCSLCLPGDYCFNNSAYNCSDALMISEAGSGFFDNCTCVSGYYNNGTVCENCPMNYYCERGKRFSCPTNEWTAYEMRRSECVCMPGFYRNQSVCVPCTNNYFCEGLDDSRQACPSNSVSTSAVGVEDCLCNISYGAVFSTNISEPHYCQLCLHTQTFKSTVGNSACLPCTQCLPLLHSSWTQIECTPRADALCDTCTVCYNASSGTPRKQYTTQACEQFFDTECANCSTCDWNTQFELIPCSETDDATCSPITYNRQCPVGYYAGGHTRTSDSQCLPCAVHNTQYEGQWLHEFTSAGRQYNNSFSCDLQCRPYSRLINNSDPSLGCTTCELGNVLFKIFTQDTFACRFTCLEGYVSVNGDCVLAAAEGNELTFWNHSLNVTHVRREEQHSDNGLGAFFVTVSHTSHGHFAVVLGPTEPTCSGRSQATLSKTALSACCFDAQWRVSTTNQLGMPASANETCSRSNAPWSVRLGEKQLQFEIPDSRLQELGNCSIFEEVLSCVVQVSIVDIILLQHFSVPLRLEITRSSALSIISTETYVPLSGIRVEAQLAYKEANGSLVLAVITDMAPLQAAGATEVLLFATGLDFVQPSSEFNCARMQVGNLSNISTNVWTLRSQYVRTLTFLRVQNFIDTGSVFVKIFYTLRLVERESTAVKNTMHIAVWRNVSTAQEICENTQETTAVKIGQVLSCSGLGQSAVAAATALFDPTDTVHGEVGGLTSFVARSLHEHVRSVKAKYMLLSFSMPPAVLHSNITEMHMGTLDFTEAFKAECTATSFCHYRYAQQGNGMHFMTSCDALSQNAARMWLRLALGVVHDDGHVAQLCKLSQWQTGHQYAFLIALVNTRAYLPQVPHWHNLQNRSAPVSTSNVFALFEFI